MKPYQLTKRVVLQDWLKDFRHDQINLFLANTSIDEWQFPDHLRQYLEERNEEECIYLMVADIAELDTVPLYIGKSNHVLKRWESHLKEFFQQKNSYQLWWNFLVQDNLFRYTTNLIVIPQSKILTPPLNGFPTTVGSVEYQLVGLASDAYADYLLNREGNRR